MPGFIEKSMPHLSELMSDSKRRWHVVTTQPVGVATPVTDKEVLGAVT